MRSPFNSVPRAWVSLLCIVLAQTAWAAGTRHRDPSIAVRFHAQVSTYDPTFAAKVTAGNPPRELIVEKIPSISERDIDSFYPYRASDGTYSVAFHLDRHGQAVLEALSSQIRGHMLLAAVNGRPVSLLKVDKIVTDGIIFIPMGLTEGDVRALGASFSIMGQTENDKEAKREPERATFSDPALPVPNKPSE